MGTNYYARINECKCCGRFEELHLGKSSAGWCFALRVDPENGINTLDDLMKLVANSPIYNEYNERVSKQRFIDIVTKRSHPTSIAKKAQRHDPYCASIVMFLQMTGAELGPNNLLRQKIGRFCIGHGKGTYDYCTGEFS